MPDKHTLKGDGMCATKKRRLPRANTGLDQEKTDSKCNEIEKDLNNYGSDIAEKVIILKPLTSKRFEELSENIQLKQVLNAELLDVIIFAESKIGVLRMNSKELVQQFILIFNGQREWFFPNMTASTSPTKPTLKNQICFWGVFHNEHSMEEFEFEIKKDKALCHRPEYSKYACLLSYKTIQDCMDTMKLHGTKVADDTVYCHFV